MNKATFLIHFLNISLCLFFSCSDGTSLDTNEKTVSVDPLLKKLNQAVLTNSEEGFELALNHHDNEYPEIKKIALKVLAQKGEQDWQNLLNNAGSFKRESSLLNVLIFTDKEGAFARIISNRLQTFDLRHLGESEQLKIIKLYDLSLSNPNNHLPGILESAHAKLTSVYPNPNTTVNQALSNMLLNSYFTQIEE